MPDPIDHAAVQRVRTAAARKGVTLEIVAFEESTHTAEEAAAAVGAELGQIVKSLVFVAPHDDGGLEPVVCLVPGPNRVDVARLAAVTGEPDIRRASAREAHDLTGFVIGGIPPIGFETTVRVIMDPDLGRYPTVWAAAGLPTAVFEVPPATLRTLANATVAPITEERRKADVEAAEQAAVADAARVMGDPAGSPPEASSSNRLASTGA
ncbi:MAG: aminoacyl-tRNA deacylase [Candidatus Limnocylindrales bacterium]